MSNKDGYKKQKNLSFAQFLSETPSFVAILVSAILSRTILVFVDLLDSFGNLLRTEDRSNRIVALRRYCIFRLAYDTWTFGLFHYLSRTTE